MRQSVTGSCRWTRVLDAVVDEGLLEGGDYADDVEDVVRWVTARFGYEC
ncbi:hypothetical protein [Actinosynnema sp. NPDC023587]